MLAVLIHKTQRQSVLIGLRATDDTDLADGGLEMQTDYATTPQPRAHARTKVSLQ